MKRQRIFGDKNLFSIEVDIKSVSGEFVYGSVILWVHNKQIGDGEIDLLTLSYTTLEKKLFINFSKKMEIFQGLTKEEIFCTLMPAELSDVYRKNSPIVSKKIMEFSGEKIVDFYCVFPDGSSSFDWVHLFNFTLNNIPFFIWHNIGTEDIYMESVDILYVQTIVRDYLDYIDALILQTN